MSNYLNYFQIPSPGNVPEDVADFLELLGGPRWFRIPGSDRNRCRAVVTLLHGNEPSGTLALMRMLREGFTPEVDLLCCVISVDAAVAKPLFSHRALPGVRDQNRCFLDEVDDRPGHIARELRSLLAAAKPEYVVDLHNTSGTGPAYSVSMEDSTVHCALTSLWTDHLIHTGIRLGTLMEGLSDIAPCITLECGGRTDTASHEIAYQGLVHYATGLAVNRPTRNVDVHHHPVRVELSPGCSVAYGLAPVPSTDVTLRPDVDAHNFSIITKGQTLAWLGPRGSSALRVRGEDDRDRAAEFFVAVGHELRARVDFKPLMVTTNAEIAASDCLFYAVLLDEEHSA